MDSNTQVLSVASNLSRVASHLEHPPKAGHGSIVQLFLGQSVAYIGLMLKRDPPANIQTAVLELLPLLGEWIGGGGLDDQTKREGMVRDLRWWGERLIHEVIP